MAINTKGGEHIAAFFIKKRKREKKVIKPIKEKREGNPLYNDIQRNFRS